MAVAAIVQARMSSARLPGKVLADVAGKPLLQYLIERLNRTRLLDGVVVATSNEPEDDPVAALCAHLHLDCHRGPLADVAGRLLGAAEQRRLEAFVRVSADSPMLDQNLVDRAVKLFCAQGCELATNISPRTFPHGESVEAIDTTAFRRAYEAMTEPADREHVTPYLYRNATQFRISAFTSERDLSSIQLSIDTPADLKAFTAMIASMDRPHWDYALEDVLELHRRCGV